MKTIGNVSPYDSFSTSNWILSTSQHSTLNACPEVCKLLADLSCAEGHRRRQEDLNARPQEHGRRRSADRGRGVGRRRGQENVGAGPLLIRTAKYLVHTTRVPSGPKTYTDEERISSARYSGGCISLVQMCEISLPMYQTVEIMSKRER